MTRKDYKIIANTVWGVSKILSLDGKDKEIIINEFCRRLAIDNCRFDARKFAEACR